MRLARNIAHILLMNFLFMSLVTLVVMQDDSRCSGPVTWGYAACG